MSDSNPSQQKVSLESLDQKPAPLGRARFFILCLSLLVMVLITAWPHFLGSTPETMNHNAAMVLMLGMSCGFVYGIGFTPKLRIWRWLFSAWSALGLMLLGVLMRVMV
ncbi:cyd operon YbgE family protein [Cellvibrio sp. PSBB023]|uniref:cyd operon YbgE family protein n=1 Tax=Cellvibrio sp. PSBB023 TaxID=1945512 RepID=UPI00143B14DF|nr:cyd operon YbgE family protein [Cellvibrio sp. PSBB023]